MKNTLPLLISLGLLGGCSAGLNSVVFTTNTSAGVDLDAEPATTNLGFSRDEVVIGPVFENGQVMPVLSTVSGSQGMGLFENHSFATGNSAVTLAKDFGDPGNTCSQAGNLLCPQGQNVTSDIVGVSKAGGEDGVWSKIKYFLVGDDNRKRVFFGTKSNLGLSMSWRTGTPVPSSLNVGYKRKEVALVPLLEEDASNNKVNVHMPSLIATAGVGAQATDAQAKTQVQQTFATGNAAMYLAGRSEVRAVLSPALLPGGEEIKKASERAEEALAARVERRKVQQEILNKFNRLDANKQAEFVQSFYAQKAYFELAENPAPSAGDFKFELAKMTASDTGIARLNVIDNML